MNLDPFFDFAETPLFMAGALVVSCVVVATAIVWGALRAAGRISNGH